MAVFQIALERKAIAGDQDHATHFLTEPRYMLITAADVEDWIPSEFVEQYRQLLKSSPEGILVLILVYLYGDLTSGFFYEYKRNYLFEDAGALRKPGTSLFKYALRYTENKVSLRST